MPLLFSHSAQKALFYRNVKSFATHKGQNVFKDGRHAEFLVSVASLSSIPPLHGLPEVNIPSQMRTNGVNRCRLLSQVSIKAQSFEQRRS